MILMLTIHRRCLGLSSRFTAASGFRFDISDAEQQNFDNALDVLLNQFDYQVPGGVIAYDYLADLGGDRHVGNLNRNAARRQQRADLVALHYMSTSRLILDCLIGPDPQQRYLLETNDDPQNPQQSSFESLHHLFCNMTNVPTSILLGVGTHWSGRQQIQCPVKF